MGAITQYVDVAQLVLYAFWAFFAGLIYYLVRENHREGYPMDTGRDDSMVVKGWPVPAPKVYKTEHGDMVVPDHSKDQRELPLARRYPTNAAPYEPTGNPMLDGVGPGSWTRRADIPETAHGVPRIRPLRVLADYSISPKNVNPIGLDVLGADDKVAGVVRDAWLDTSDMLIRYLELSVTTPSGVRSVLVPMNFCRVRSGKGAHIKVHSVLANQFADAPALKSDSQITLDEEERVAAYYGGGRLYATPERQEPLA